MHPFACPNCRQPLHFEARLCLVCGSTLAYDPAIDAMRFLADQATVWRDDHGEAAPLVACANNRDHQVCNWLVAEDDPGELCPACRHNRTLPDLTVDGVMERWMRVEAAKRRLIHSLLRLRLPLETPAEAPEGLQGLCFDILYDPAAEQGQPARIMTGHDDGLITLNLIEADDAARERTRVAMGEPYRTLLGHFRHETGHHYWARLVQPDPQRLAEFRTLFGDERQDYGEALKAHYARSDDGSWFQDYVSFYATSHPWEDFAETFAHYLHIADMLDTARGFDLSFATDPEKEARAAIAGDPWLAPAPLLAEALGPLAFAVNALCRSMGQHDVYPFALGPGVITRLDFIARLVAAARQEGATEKVSET
jgi:hypothetical protein